ncbi:MAG: shikimate kinase [Gammaproteobacteria bacterium]|tara:strand:- start:565 stop:1062 length:498 start_codon:yes stop_codon:yes gene_type:complete
MNNITFIGMAGCGKSTIGRGIADKLDINFVDTDVLIENKHHLSLEQIKQEYGYKFVREEEEKVILGLSNFDKVISTGGSAIYSLKSMDHLKTFSKIVYINTPLEIIIERIDIGQERGLAVPDGMTIPEVYSERKTLYEKYAKYTIDGSSSIESLIEEVEDIFVNG